MKEQLGMDHIIASLKKNNMSDSSIEELLLYAVPRRYAKREILTSTAAKDPYFYLIEQGITRSYSIIDGHEVTSWFSMEGDITFSSPSFYGVLEGYETETVQVLEPSLIYTVPIAWLEELYTRNLEVANWSRCLHQDAHIGSVHRLISLLYHSAEERYVELLKKNPQLFQRVNLGYIASYLGISQVTLSQLRRRVLI